MIENELAKELFAVAWLRTPDNPFKAACQVFTQDTAKALRASVEWVTDIFVLTRQAELLQEFGEENFMPSKFTTARRVFELAENTAAQQKDRIKAYELYANMMGYIPKQALIGHQTNVVEQHNRVMVVRDFGGADEWEKAAKAQQARLIEHSRD